MFLRIDSHGVRWFDDFLRGTSLHLGVQIFCSL